MVNFRSNHGMLATGAVGGGLAVLLAMAVRKRLSTPAGLQQTKTCEETEAGSTNEGSTRLLLESRSRVDENLRLIRQVLHFWFGQAPPNENQKQLWMIQEERKRREVDNLIVDTFGNLLIELATGERRRWNEWTSETETYGYQGKLAAIVVLDQFSRHIHRHHKETGKHDPISDVQRMLPPQVVLDELGLATSRLFVEQHGSEMDTGMVPIPMYIFALMPFRHASRIQTLEYVRDQIESKLVSLIENSDAMLRRFRKASSRRLAVLQDEARRTGSSRDEAAVCQRKIEFSDEEILELLPFEADMTTAKDHIVYTTISNFLAKQGIAPVADTKGGAHGEGPIVPIIVSLSGGVDSMVIASVLANMARSQEYKNRLKAIAVHIDYGNRPESAAEASFVERWCDEQGIDFYCRRIDEVTRGITARDEYEKFSREVRYSFYKDTMAKYSDGMTSSPTIGVVLGHHRGDLRENVLSNAHKGCGPLDLSGMTAVSLNNGVTLYRPLLPLEKTAIFAYSHEYGIPYFKDTTPHWSTRGKLRNKLLPLLQEIYGDGCMNNLSQLAVESDQCRALVDQVALKPFLDKIVRKKIGINFSTLTWKSFDIFFWKVALREALHRSSLGMFSDKSIDSYLDRVAVDRVRSGWLQCRKDYAVYLQDDGRVFVLFPTYFPWRKVDQFHLKLEGVSVPCPTLLPHEVGPWRLTVVIKQQSDEQPAAWQSMLEERAVSSMDHFLDGKFKYHLVVPTWPSQKNGLDARALVFRRFTKRNRPRAWKGIDPKLQETIPLLGCDAISDAALADPGFKGASTTLFLLEISYWAV